jgi:hypothetical protein
MASYEAKSLFGPKYRAVDGDTAESSWPKLEGRLARRYRHELDALAHGGQSKAFPSWKELATEARAGVPLRTRTALELVGDPGQVYEQVTYPRLQEQGGQPAPEAEHFHWFVENNRQHRKALKPIEPGSGGSG